MVAEPDRSEPPRTLVGGRFEVLDLLGQGGMGVVYRALDRERSVQLAIKTLRGATPRGVLRFKTEFRALRDIRHPNLVELGELFESDGTWLFTMELVRGARLLAWVSGVADAPMPTPSLDSMLQTGEGRSEAPTAIILAPAALPGRQRDTPAPVPPRDDVRLRTAFAGLASGLSALHRAGKVHRDIKPSNVLVDEAGRTVLLDFGVVAELWQADVFEPHHVIGTVSYMAPEQARGDEVGPAADWYAFGAVLYQAISGRLPLAAGSQEALIYVKNHEAPYDLAELVPGVPVDLARLCMRLLDRDPRARPSEVEVFAALGVPRTESELAWSPQALDGQLFVGRGDEVATLEAALADSRRAAVYIEIAGESGVGKTALVQHFCELVRATRGQTAILRGRCHERERIGFNAFDGIVDDLARWLVARGEPRTRHLVPRNAADLLAVFPDLRVVPWLEAVAAQPAGDLRGRAFGALAELFGRIAERRPLVLAIDDIQWADDDSLALLDELMRGRRAPKMLVIATARSDRTRRRASTAGTDHRRIELAGLLHADAERLVQRLGDEPARDADQLIAETRGHPLFLVELIRHRARTHTAIHLEDAIWARASTLDGHARRVLEAIAVAATPLARDAIAAAAGLDPADAAVAVERLVREQLARVHGPRRTHVSEQVSGQVIEPFHDRVREAVLAHEPGEPRAALHGRLAAILEARGAEPDVLFVHHEAAGDHARAAHYLERAADAALHTFAFARAAELYRHALASPRLAPAERCALLARLAESLANDGRSAEAGERYLEAASLADVDSDRQLDLLRRAAERLLMSGRLEAGLATAKAVLARVDMTLPASRSRTIAGIVWNQLRTRKSALVWEPRAEPADPRSLRAEICWSLGAGLAMVDTLLGAYYSGHAAVLALRHGTSVQIARALSAATVGAAMLGRRERTAYLMSAAERAAAEDATSITAWYAELARTAVVFVLDNDFRRCLAMASALEDSWFAAGRGSGWEVDIARHFALASLQMLGELGVLADRVETIVDAARRTGDLFSEVTLRVRFAVRHLLVDRPDIARADIHDALAAWQPSAETFGNQRAWALWSRTRIELYTGDLARLEPELDDEWHRMRRSLVGRVPIMKVEWSHAYASYLLGRAQLALRERRPRDHAALCRDVERIADSVGRLEFPAAPAVALLVRAGVAWARNADTVTTTRAALDAAIARDFLVFVPFLYRRLGEAIGGDEGATLIAAGDRGARERGFANPERGAEIAIPTGRFL